MIPNHVSKTIGDGLGYDIKSYDQNEEEIFIEVKATQSIKAYSIHLSNKEFQILQAYPGKYYIYVVSNVNSKATILIYSGSDLLENSTITPDNYKIYF